MPEPYYGNTSGAQFDSVAPFADPFADLASVMMPASVPAMLRHAEFFSVGNETLRAAYNRVSSYFNTTISVVGDLGDDEKQDQKDYLRQELGIYEFLGVSGVDFLTYGMSYTSVLKPFVRYVACPKCKTQYRLGEFNSRPEYQYTWAAGIRGRCPACRFSGVFADRTRRPIDLEDEGRASSSAGGTPTTCGSCGSSRSATRPGSTGSSPATSGPRSGWASTRR